MPIFRFGRQFVQFRERKQALRGEILTRIASVTATEHAGESCSPAFVSRSCVSARPACFSGRRAASMRQARKASLPRRVRPARLQRAASVSQPREKARVRSLHGRPRVGPGRPTWFRPQARAARQAHAVVRTRAGAQVCLQPSAAAQERPQLEAAEPQSRLVEVVLVRPAAVLPALFRTLPARSGCPSPASRGNGS